MGGLNKAKDIKVEVIKSKTSSTIDNTETHDKQKKEVVLKEKKDPSKRLSHHNSGEMSAKVVITKGGKFAFIKRKVADKLIANGQGYAYAKKSQWKELVRDSKEPALLEIPTVIV
jgi:hypothetical protein